MRQRFTKFLKCSESFKSFQRFFTKNTTKKFWKARKYYETSPQFKNIIQGFMRFWLDSRMFHEVPTRIHKAPKGSVGNSLDSTGIDGVELGCIMFHKAPRDPDRCHMVPKVWKVVQGAR